jgi:hypothetical protein
MYDDPVKDDGSASLGDAAGSCQCIFVLYCIVSRWWRQCFVLAAWTSRFLMH